MGAYLLARLTDHSSQVAAGAILAAVGAGLSGTMSWQTVVTTSVAALVPLLAPATK